MNSPTISSAQSADNSNQEFKIGVYENDINYDNFRLAAKKYMGHPWFTFQLANLTEEAVTGMIQQAVESNAYGGYMITPDRGRMSRGGDGTNAAPNATYLDDEFFRLSKITIVTFTVKNYTAGNKRFTKDKFQITKSPYVFNYVVKYVDIFKQP